MSDPTNGRRDAFLNDNDLLGQIDDLLDPLSEDDEDALPATDRQTKIRPHEIDRRARQMTVTFATAAWPNAIRDQAAAWGIRESDLVTYAVSLLMRGIQDHTIHRPVGDHPRHYHRAGETLDLPWRPQ